MNPTNESLKTIAKGAGIVFLGLLISKVLTFLYRIIVARVGSQEYGLLSIGIAFLGIISAISLMGLDSGIIRYVSYYKNKPEKIKGIIKFSTILSVSVSIIIATLVFIFSNWISVNIFHDIRLSFVLRVLVIAVPFIILTEIFVALFKAFKNVKYEFYSRSVGESLVKLLLTLIFLLFGLKLLGITLAYTLSIIISAMLAFYFLKKKIFPLISETKTEYISKELIFYSLPLLLGSIIHLVISWIDTLMIGFFKNVEDVGIYNVALPIANLSYMLPYALMALFFPVLTELYSENKKEAFKNVVKITTKWTFIFNLILLVVIILFSKEILTFLFGAEYVIGYKVLITLGVSYFLVYLLLPAYYILLVMKKTKQIFWTITMGALINIILNYVLIPKYGIIGAAWATGVSLLSIALILGTLSYKLTKINPFEMKYYIRILFSIIIAGLFINYTTKIILPINNVYIFLFALCLFVVIYFVMLLITKSLVKEDVMIIKSIINKIKNFSS